MVQRSEDIARKIVSSMRSKGYSQPFYVMEMSTLIIFLDELSSMREQGKIEFDEKYTVQYLNLVLGKVLKPKELVYFFNEIEEKLHCNTGVLSNEWESMLSHIQERDLVEYVHMITEIKLEDSSERYEVLCKIIETLSFPAGTGYGQFLTGYSCTRLIARLANCKNDMTVYDPFAGSGLTVIETASDEGIIFAQEINSSLICIITILSIIRGVKIGKIQAGDSLLDPISYDEFNVVICDAPMIRRHDKDYLWRMHENNYIYEDDLNNNFVFIRHALARLKDDGVAIAVVPMSVLFSSSKMEKIRANLVQDRYIDAVIELPDRFYSNSTTVKAAILIMKKNKIDSNVYMLDVSRNNMAEYFVTSSKGGVSITEEGIQKIYDMYTSKVSLKGVAENVPFEEIADNNFNLCTMQYLVDTNVILTKDVDVDSLYQKQEMQKERLLAYNDMLKDIRGRFL